MFVQIWLLCKYLCKHCCIQVCTCMITAPQGMLVAWQKHETTCTSFSGVVMTARQACYPLSLPNQAKYWVMRWTSCPNAWLFPPMHLHHCYVGMSIGVLTVSGVGSVGSLRMWPAHVWIVLPSPFVLWFSLVLVNCCSVSRCAYDTTWLCRYACFLFLKRLYSAHCLETLPSIGLAQTGSESDSDIFCSLAPPWWHHSFQITHR